MITRYIFLENKEDKINKLTENLKPLSIMGLLVTVIILLGLQAN